MTKTLERISPSKFPALFADRAARYYAFAGLLIAAAYVFFLNPYPDFAGYNPHDSAYYVNRAVSVWKGLGPVQTYANFSEAVKLQQPGFPILLAPAAGLSGANFFAMKAFMVFLACLMAGAYFIFFLNYLRGRKIAVLAVLLLMACPVIFRLSHETLAEIPLFLFTGLSLLSLERYLDHSEKWNSRFLYWAAAAITAAYFMKPTALAVIGGGWFLLLHPGRRNGELFRKLLVYSALAALPVILWQMQNRHVPADSFMTRPFLDFFVLNNPYEPGSPPVTLPGFVARVRDNLVLGIFPNVAQAVLAPLYFSARGVPGFLWSLPAVMILTYSWARSFLRVPSLLEGFVFFSIALLAVGYDGKMIRYAAIVYPAVLVYALRWFVDIGRERGFSAAQWILLPVSILVMIATGLSQSKILTEDIFLKNYMTAASYARNVFPKDSLCVAPMAAYWQILSGHRCMVPRGTDEVSSWPAYYGMSSGRLREQTEPSRGIHGDIKKSADRIAKKVWEDDSLFSKVFENDHFLIMTRAGSHEKSD